jgi:DNA-binding NtrC family response regulator
MPADDETCDDSRRMTGAESLPLPGIMVVLGAGRPAAHAVEVGAGGLELGRGSLAGLLESDERISRRHVRITPRAGGWAVEDLGSRNGTFVDGQPVASGPALFTRPVLVRIGRSLIWAVDDVRPFVGHAPGSPEAEGPILGGVSRRAFGEIALASRASDTILVHGESGAGKELGARAFHEARHGAGSNAPFVAVNCAAIPEGLAERLLFGARKGAFSGATNDADGYVQAADKGTLFLDEIAELDPLVQAKLLRVLETREVLPLGASRTKKVEISVCAASHRRLRDEVAAGRFREDLYFRIGRPEVAIPPLREPIDEIPWFIARGLRGVDPQLTASAGFVETCALRPWPGNVRELLREVTRAGHRALEAGSDAVEREHLLAEAGAPVVAGAPATAPGASPSSSTPPANGPRREGIARWSDDEVRRVLGDNAGNVRATARALDVHRNQLRRWLERHGQGQGPETEPPDADD